MSFRELVYVHEGDDEVHRAVIDIDVSDLEASILSLEEHHGAKVDILEVNEVRSNVLILNDYR